MAKCNLSQPLIDDLKSSLLKIKIQYNRWLCYEGQLMETDEWLRETLSIAFYCYHQFDIQSRDKMIVAMFNSEHLTAADNTSSLILPHVHDILISNESDFQ